MRWFVLFLLLWSVPVWSKIYIDITNPASHKIGVALENVGLPLKDFDRVLVSDLRVYGIFALYPLERYRLTGAELRLIGADLLLHVDKSVFGSRFKVAYTIRDLTDGSTVEEGTFEGGLSRQVDAAHRIADALYKAVTGSEGMFSRRAVAFRRVAGGYELVLVDVGAVSYKRLAFFKEPAQSPALSPDGRKIIFSKMNKAGEFDLYLYDLETGRYSRVCRTPCPDTAPSWMPDSRRVVFSGCVDRDNLDILICDVDTGRITKRVTRSIAIDTSPSLSPDGKRVAFVSNRERYPHIYIKGLDASGAVRITGGHYDVSPDWSPRGNEVAFASLMEGRFAVGVYNLDTGATKYLAPGEDPAWSPNGDYILYTRRGGLYISSVYGSGEIRLFVGGWTNPSWR